MEYRSVCGTDMDNSTVRRFLTHGVEICSCCGCVLCMYIHVHYTIRGSDHRLAHLSHNAPRPQINERSYSFASVPALNNNSRVLF